MKKLLFLIIPLLTFTARADEKSAQILDRVAKKVEAMGTYRVDFSVTADGNTSQGTYTVSGNRYFISVGPMEIISDGRVKYEIDHSFNEVMIDNVRAGSNLVLSDPTKIFDFTANGITSSYGGKARADGRQCDRIELDFGNDLPIDNVELFVDETTSLPVELRYVFQDGMQAMTLTVKTVTAVGDVPESLFKFDKANYRDYEIVDFR